MPKRLILILIVFIAAISAFYFYSLFKKDDLTYITADCSIYSKNGKIMFYTDGRLCDFSDDGKVISARPNDNILKMVDKNNEILWTSYENVHHDLKFTNDQKAILLITSEMIEFQNKKVKSDCFSKRDLNNKIIYQWCLSENLKNMEKLGFIFYPNKGDPFAVNKLINTKYEISHANSIYEIKENDLSDKIEAFQEGNFLVNIFFPSHAMLILDKNMKNILWSKNLSDLRYGLDRLEINTHDSQVSSDGKILSYANSAKIHYFPILYNSFIRNDKPKVTFKTHSSLIKFDPITDNIDWVYEATPPHSFASEFLGSVTQLKNNNYLFSDYTNGNAIYEVSRNREIIWKLALPANIESKIRKTKPLYNTSFLKARGLIEE